MARVIRTLVLAAEPEEVWALIGDFNAMAQWHPGIASSEMFDGDGQTIRVLNTADGGAIRENLIARDDDARRYSYGMVDTPLPVKNYAATIVVEDAEGGCTVHWSGEFEPAGMSGEKAEAVIAAIYEAGFEGLKARFGLG